MRWEARTFAMKQPENDLALADSFVTVAKLAEAAYCSLIPLPLVFPLTERTAVLVAEAVHDSVLQCCHHSGVLRPFNLRRFLEDREATVSVTRCVQQHVERVPHRTTSNDGALGEQCQEGLWP